jgi:hypothetical protein
MPKVGAPYFNGLCDKTCVISKKARADWADLCATYSAFDANRDMRIYAFSGLIRILDSFQFAMVFIGHHLLDPSWWKQSTKEGWSPSTEQTVVAFADMNKIGFSFLLFACFESAARAYLRALDPNACKRGTGPAKSVYDCLIKSKLAAPPKGAIEFLDLLRCTRNTLHNAGRFCDPNGRDRAFTWRGVTYELRHGHSASFATPEFLLAAADEVRTILRAIAEDSNLKAIKHEIPPV